MPSIDETEGWIFSDSAHRWMDRRRAEHAAWARVFTHGTPRIGWEYGLFGLKNSNSGAPAFHCFFTDDDPGTILL